MGFVFIYVTVSSAEEAKSIIQHLLSRKMIACANYFPIRSIYRWKGILKQESEVVLLLKTTARYAAKVQREIEKKHSYDVPCVTVIPVKPNTSYAQWLRRQLGTRKVFSKGTN